MFKQDKYDQTGCLTDLHWPLVLIVFHSKNIWSLNIVYISINILKRLIHISSCMLHDQIVEMRCSCSWGHQGLWQPIAIQCSWLTMVRFTLDMYKQLALCHGIVLSSWLSLWPPITLPLCKHISLFFLLSPTGSANLALPIVAIVWPLSGLRFI